MAGQTPLVPPPPRRPLSATRRDLDGGPTQVTEEPVPLEPMPPVPRPPKHSVPGSGLADVPAIAMYGRYEVLGRLAMGGMAEILLGRDRAGGAVRYVVIKRIMQSASEDAQFIQMFLDEARLVMHLNHPNICTLYEFGEEAGTHFLAMEHIHGVSLGKFTRRARDVGGVPPPIAAKVIAQVAAALDYAHGARGEHGQPLEIVHRDVSPQNIMLRFDGLVKLLDFGIARAETQMMHTKAGVLKGKFPYMSPEQCQGKPLDARSDIFALGVCLYQVLAGKGLYQRATEYETLRAIVEEPVPSLRDVMPGISEGLDEVMRRALAKDPNDRFQTAGEMQDALEDWLAEERLRVNAAKIRELLEVLFADEIEEGPWARTPDFGLSQVHHLALQERAVDAGAMAGLPGELADVLEPVVDVDVPVDELEKALGGRPKTWWFVAAGLAALVLSVGGLWIGSLVAGSSESEPVTGSSADSEEGPPPPEHAPPDQETGGLGAVELAVARTPVETGDRAPEPEPAPTGSVRVRSTPPNAQLRIDGERHGTTPTEVHDLNAGVHRIELRLSGYRTWRADVDVFAGDRTDHEATLARASGGSRVGSPEPEPEPPAPTGRLSIATRPYSQVFLGNRLLGTTPIGSAEVESGTLRLRFVDRDDNIHHRTVRVPPGGRERVFFDFTERE